MLRRLRWFQSLVTLAGLELSADRTDGIVSVVCVVACILGVLCWRFSLSSRAKTLSLWVVGLGTLQSILSMYCPCGSDKEALYLPKDCDSLCCNDSCAVSICPCVWWSVSKEKARKCPSTYVVRPLQCCCLLWCWQWSDNSRGMGCWALPAEYRWLGNTLVILVVKNECIHECVTQISQ